MAQAKKPTTADDWMTLRFEIQMLFDGAPIEEEELFAGRSAEVRKIIETVFARARHVVLFGDRGVGKTSLANVFWKRFNKTLRSFVVARIQAGPHDNFSSLWIRALDELQAQATLMNKGNLVPVESGYEVITPSQIRRELQKCNANVLPIIIIDEYNEVKDADAKRLTANLLKELYDFSVTTTIVLVGVGDNISELIQDHKSVDRAVIEVPLRRMDNSELTEIIDKRIKRTVMKFSADAVWTIILLSKGLPYFTQTLSKHAALHAIDDRRTVVSNSDVESSMDRFIDDAQQRFKDAYRDATRSNQANNFQESLLACALAKTDDEGFFTANDVVEPYTAIMGEKKRIAHFEKHLRRFSGDEGGNILTRKGGERQTIFRFSDPMMQPYVIIRGIQSKIIDEKARSLLLKKEQRELPI